MDTDEYTAQFETLDANWADPALWVNLMESPGVADLLPENRFSMAILEADCRQQQ